MDDMCAYQTELTPKSRMKRNAIVGGAVAVVVAIFVSNVSGSPPDNSAMKNQTGTFTQPIMVPAVAANSTQPFGATATTANSTQPVEVLATPANSNQPTEALYGEVDHSVATTGRFREQILRATSRRLPPRSPSTPRSRRRSQKKTLRKCRPDLAA